jgi:hypothetical protein
VLTNPSPWERLWPLLVTAGLSLLVLWFAQRTVIPLSDARKRREDRWEQDVLALGELLVFEYADAWSALASTAQTFAHLHSSDFDDRQGARLDELRNESRLALRSARTEHAKAAGRLDWLTNRVRAADPTRQDLVALWMRSTQLRFHAYDLDSYVSVGESPSYSTDDVDRVASKHRDLQRKVIEMVERLADQRAPRRASWLRRKYRDRRARWKQWRAKLRPQKVAPNA